MTLEEAVSTDWGCINLYDWGMKPKERCAAWKEAENMHCLAMKAHPEKHHMTETETRRSYYEVKCSCGFHYSYDCSD